MAILLPTIEGIHPSSIGQQREFEVLRLLQDGLPDDYTVFHGVCWSSVYEDVQWFGEIDAIVQAPNASLVLLEVKAGPVEVTEQGIYKRYADRRKDVGHQTRVQHASLRQRLKEEKLHVYVAQLLVLPDQKVTGGSVHYPRERIVDQDDMPSLCTRIVQAVPRAAKNSSSVSQVSRFLEDVFGLDADPSARIGWLEMAVSRLSEGLATWAPRITAPHGRVFIDATAGSGKTQLALKLLTEAAAQGQRARYVCFNRPLAEQLRRQIPEAVEVATFHELAMSQWRQVHGAPDFADLSQFSKAEAHFVQQPVEADLDLLIVDETQDFDAAWVDHLLRRVKPAGRAYFLGDEDQRLFDDRAAWNDPTCVRIRCPDNFRNPRQIARTLEALRLSSQAITPRCPLDGEVPGFHVWNEDDGGVVGKTAEVIDALLADGVKAEHIAVLSLRGIQGSQVLRQSRLGAHAIKRFTGQYDAAGQALWSEGSVLADTVHRFKGQAAPVVVLTELDFASVDDRLRRRLFVGMTRAQWRLECVMSSQAESALAQILAT